MTSAEAREIIKWIQRDKIKPGDLYRFEQIGYRAEAGINPDPIESKFLNDVYRYTNGGGERQDQPFKQYRRKKSWGV